MGFIRKLTSISSMGAVNYKSPREKAADAAARNSKANKKAAAAQVRLLEAQARIAEAQARRAERDG